MALADDKKCDGCGADLRGAAIPEDSLHCYNSGPNGEFLATIEDYRAIADQLDNPTTHFSRVIGVEYQDGFDGVSEWRCPDCGRREGRFSGKVLEDGEEEVRPR
jgi:hypothetical protein